MNMTYSAYISNPMGKKNSVYSNRTMYKELYTKKLNTLIVREAGKIDYTLYIDKKNGTYYIHMKVPSEVIPKFYYDTIIQFYTDNNEVAMSRTLKNYFVKFYSNDPSFVFTFAHAMMSNDMFVKDLIPKMSKQAVKKLAVEKNPKNEVGYVKSIYFTYLLMNIHNLFSKISFEVNYKVYDKNVLIKNIIHADEKILARQNAQTDIDKSKSISKKKEQNNSRDSAGFVGRSEDLSIRNMNNVVKRTPFIGGSNGINKTKRTSKVKKI